MMDIRLPHLGEDSDSGTVAAIFVKQGDVVEVDQALIEIESDKAVASVPSTAAGTVTAVHVEEGDEIRAGTRIVSLEPASGQADSSDPGTAAAPPEEPSRQVAIPPTPGPPPKGPVARPTPIEGIPPAASPSIRRMARGLGIDLTRLAGTGRGGRIVLGDVREYIQQLQQAGAAAPEQEARPSKPAVDFSKWGPVEKTPASKVRRIIAERMSESWATVPHVFQFGDADITELMEHRRKYAPIYKERGARLTLTPMVLRAIALTLPAHPKLNSSLDEASAEIVTKKYFHIGIAVDTEAGLVVPVLRDVGGKSVFELAEEIEHLAERARERKLSREDMQGGTFTLSNQGGIGGGHFTPIINKPEVAILGMGRGRKQPRLVEGALEDRMLLPLVLSHDHRVVDGADGVRFLVNLVAALEGLSEADIKPD